MCVKEIRVDPAAGAVVSARLVADRPEQIPHEPVGVVAVAQPVPRRLICQTGDHAYRLCGICSGLSGDKTRTDSTGAGLPEFFDAHPLFQIDGQTSHFTSGGRKCCFRAPR